MSDVNQASGQTNEPSGGIVDNPNSGKDSVSFDTHRKLLSQYKKNQERLDKLEAENKQTLLEKQKLEGNKDEVIKQLETDLGETKNKMFGFVKAVSDKTIKSEAIKEAMARGLQSDKLDKFWKLSQDAFKSEDIQLNENFEIISKDSFNRVLEQQVKENQEWFTRSVAEPRDLTPGQKPINAPKKDMKDMTVDELAEML